MGLLLKQKKFAVGVENTMETFLSQEELKGIGFKASGNHVYIGRTVIFYHPQEIEIGDHVRIDDYCIISGKIKLGSYIHIGHYCALYGGESGIVMKDYSGLSSRCSLYATSDDYSGEYMTNPMLPEEYENVINSPILLDRYAIVGTGCSIMPGVTIGEGCAVGSMSLVLKDTEPWTINVGIPSRSIKPRSKKLLNYEQLLDR